MKKTLSPYVLLLVIHTVLAFSQKPELKGWGIGGKASGLEKPIVADEYIVMPGDSVLVTVTGSINYSYVSPITYEGKIGINIPVTSLPTAQGIYVPQYDIVAAVPIHNLTLSGARDSLSRVFHTYFRNITVDITLIAIRTFAVLVVGEVVKPGIMLARPIDRVSVVLDSIGGVTEIGSRARIELRRNGTLAQLVDLDKFESTGDTDVNPYVRDGDVIYVPKMEKMVRVQGAFVGREEYLIESPQTETKSEVLPSFKISEAQYELLDGETVLDIINKTSGVNSWADLHNVYIQRGNQHIIIDLAAIFADENSSYNILMEDGDILNIPSLNAVVYVQGLVAKPGPFVFQPNLGARDYIGLAGGPLDEASLQDTYIERGNKKIPLKKDPIIEQGDRIYVPRQMFKFWQDHLDILAVVASLIISYLSITK